MKTVLLYYVCSVNKWFDLLEFSLVVLYADSRDGYTDWQRCIASAAVVHI